jgi:ketosteroid isomerase-like protein
MSQENVDVVRRSIDAVNRRQIEQALGFIDPEAELHSAIVGGTEGNVYRGHAGFRRFADSFECFDVLETELTEFRELGDRVIAFGHIHARGRESGLELDSPTGWVFTRRESKVVKADGFLSRAEALEAAGLQE